MERSVSYDTQEVSIIIPVSLYIPAEGGMLYHTYAPPFVRVTQAQVNLLLTMSDIEEIINELYVVILSIGCTRETHSSPCEGLRNG